MSWFYVSGERRDGVLKKEIYKEIKKEKGKELPSFLSYPVFEGIVRKQIEKIRSPAIECLTHVNAIVEKITLATINEKLSRFEPLKMEVNKLMNQERKKAEKNARDALTSIFAMENLVFTQDGVFAKHMEDIEKEDLEMQCNLKGINFGSQLPVKTVSQSSSVLGTCTTTGRTIRKCRRRSGKGEIFGSPGSEGLQLATASSETPSFATLSAGTRQSATGHFSGTTRTQASNSNFFSVLTPAKPSTELFDAKLTSTQPSDFFSIVNSPSTKGTQASTESSSLFSGSMVNTPSTKGTGLFSGKIVGTQASTKSSGIFSGPIRNTPSTKGTGLFSDKIVSTQANTQYSGRSSGTIINTSASQSTGLFSGKLVSTQPAGLQRHWGRGAVTCPAVTNRETTQAFSFRFPTEITQPVSVTKANTGPIVGLAAMETSPGNGFDFWGTSTAATGLLFGTKNEVKKKNKQQAMLRKHTDWFREGEVLDVEHMVKCLEAYCDVAATRMVDTIPMAIYYHLVKKLLEGMATEMIKITTEPESQHKLLREDTSTIFKRKKLLEKQQRLEKATIKLLKFGSPMHATDNLSDEEEEEA